MRFQYGDLLRYPEEMDAGGLYRFMFLEVAPVIGRPVKYRYHHVVVVQCPVDDDLWFPGSIILAGENELVRATDD